MPTTTLDFFRHGQTMHSKRFGFPDEPLTEEGHNQMWRAVGTVFPWRTIFTSPYVRCTEFAGALAERARIPVVELPELRALDWGAWTAERHGGSKKIRRRSASPEANGWRIAHRHGESRDAGEPDDPGASSRSTGTSDRPQIEHPGDRRELV